MRNTHGEGRAQAAPRQEAVDVMGMFLFYCDFVRPIN